LIQLQPKYWCKFCEIYVKDTKFERGQHEATGRHQGNIQRSLRGLHRAQEYEQRDKARAQAEVARLNGLVPSASKGGPSVAIGSGGPPPTYEKRPEKKATLEDRKKQWEQLAALGVTLPDQARGDLAIAGDWKTVSEVVGEVNEDGEFKALALNKGVRKRKLDEEEEEQKEAGEVITKRKGWGHTYKSFPGSKGGEDDVESLLVKKTPQASTGSAQEESGLKKEEPQEDDTGVALQDIPTAEEAEAAVKREEEDAPAVPAVVFKKRKKAVK
jgi:hypothetical protein